MLPFYTPWKLQKTCGYRKGTLAWNGLTNNLNWCMHQVIHSFICPTLIIEKPSVTTSQNSSNK